MRENIGNRFFFTWRVYSYSTYVRFSCSILYRTILVRVRVRVPCCSTHSNCTPGTSAGYEHHQTNKFHSIQFPKHSFRSVPFRSKQATKQTKQTKHAQCPPLLNYAWFQRLEQDPSSCAQSNRSKRKGMQMMQIIQQKYGNR